MSSQKQARRPAYPAMNCSSQSAFQHSSSSISSTATTSSFASSSRSIPMAQQSQPSYAHAPLPSPTQHQQPFFSNMNGAQSSAQQLETLRQYQLAQQMAEEQAEQARQQYLMLQAQQAQQYPSSSAYQQASYGYAQDRSAAGSSRNETSAYIGHHSLLAEAAKRAQMAVLERDLGGIEL